MGRWTPRLSAELGLLAVLLTCCCAQGEEANHFMSLKVTHPYVILYPSSCLNINPQPSLF